MNAIFVADRRQRETMLLSGSGASDRSASTKRDLMREPRGLYWHAVDMALCDLRRQAPCLDSWQPPWQWQGGAPHRPEMPALLYAPVPVLNSATLKSPAWRK